MVWISPAPADTPEQIIRNKELTAEAFPNGNAPTYGMATLDPSFCGKWKVSDL